ncbi:hypothetical protein Plim_0193 [Planctopirus limnophila DSM 3776]|uniref:Uncharacterized protein n=1 Tax=Planctopirus limnophila (strain ATCC 43296 / DSM 3776 / IFAM 1008 / Mu 290) TaxID=521674 RepID=D5SNB8_PLAL2|nr:hypothetical protein [Planctopirus limnophila]ADG66045.1 hypothetical protein Plim_0193 [Planctopirus limnophila DSM 3776]
METTRELTAEEVGNLANQLQNAYDSIQDSYEYPLDDLIDYLQQSQSEPIHEVEESDGVAARYFLYFSSPPETWEALCGREGIYTVDAKTLRANNFDISVMN